MPIPDDLIQQLEKVIRLFRDSGVPQDKLQWAVGALVKRVYSVRPGRKPRIDKQTVFDAITTWRKGQSPSPSRMARFVEQTFGCPKEQARKLAKTYRILYIDGIRQLLSVQHLAPLSQSDRSHLEKNFRREWKESEALSRAVAKEIARAQKELDALAKEAEQQRPQSPRKIFHRSDQS